MKTIKLYAAIAISIAIISCKKNTGINVAPSGDFPASVTTSVSKALMDTLKKAGMTIYPGITPPLMNGIFAMKSDSAIYAGGMKIGDSDKSGDPLIFNFYGQSNADFTIALKFKDEEDADFTGGGISKTFISGTGNNFTIFATAATLSGYGASATFLIVISGTLAPTGINHFQYCTYLFSKTDGDNSGVDTPVGYFSIDEEAHPFLHLKCPHFNNLKKL